MNRRFLLQCFAAILFAAPAAIGSSRAEVYRASLTDVDGNTVSLADGHITVVTIVTRANQHDGRFLGERIPHRYYGNENLRLLVVVNLQRKFFAVLHGFVDGFVRHRLDLEAKRLRPIYEANKVTHDPRHDLHVVTDFESRQSVAFGVPAESSNTVVIVLGRGGEELARWSKLPESEVLADVLARALADQ
jgi:hypothetical protein